MTSHDISSRSEGADKPQPDAPCRVADFENSFEVWPLDLPDFTPQAWKAAVSDADCESILDLVGNWQPAACETSIFICGYAAAESWLTRRRGLLEVTPAALAGRTTPFCVVNVGPDDVALNLGTTSSGLKTYVSARHLQLADPKERSGLKRDSAKQGTTYFTLSGVEQGTLGQIDEPFAVTPIIMHWLAVTLQSEYVSKGAAWPPGYTLKFQSESSYIFEENVAIRTLMH